jgi:hypothetical protein
MQMCSRIDAAQNLRGFNCKPPVGEYLPNPAVMGGAAGFRGMPGKSPPPGRRALLAAVAANPHRWLP